jgi:hypothetical protein
VIVPGFGGFMAHHVDARYDGRDSMFLPPLRTIGFNPQLQMNDSLLALSYVEAYDISYPEALNRIADEVTEMRQTLENSGKFELNDIGTIILNEDGNYTFEPCEAGILVKFFLLSGFAELGNSHSDAKLLIAIRTNENETLTCLILGLIEGDKIIAFRTTYSFHILFLTFLSLL